jgi:HTH-type transcriptional regulator/antitoxin MqsA
MSSICPICEKGTLGATQGTDKLNYSGKQIEVPGVEFSVCDNCHQEVVLPDQAKRNDVRFADAKRAAEGLLLGAEIHAVRKALKLSQAEAADVFGGGVNAFSKYERGEVMQSLQMDLLLRIASDIPVARDWLLTRAGVSLHWENLPASVATLYPCEPARSMRRRSEVVVVASDESEPWTPIAAAL